MVDMFRYHFKKKSILNKWGLATTASQISGSINCDFYLFPHEVTKKKQVREDEAPADNKKVRKSRIQSSGSVSTNYCDFSKHLIIKNGCCYKSTMIIVYNKYEQMKTVKSCLLMMLLQSRILSMVCPIMRIHHCCLQIREVGISI